MGYSEEAKALFTRLEGLSVPATDARKAIIDRCIRALIACGAFAKRDAYYLIGANELTWRQNWKQNAYNLTLVSTPTFAADSHVVGNGTSSCYDTNFNPSTAVGAKFQQNDCSQFCYAKTDLANGAAVSYDFGNPIAWIGRHNTVPGRSNGRPQTASTIGAMSIYTYPGYVGWSRSGSTTWRGMSQGFDYLTSDTTVSAALYNSTFRVCGVNGFGFGTNQIMAAGFGGNLTPAEAAAEKAAIRRYLQDIGAIPITIAAYGDSISLGVGSTDWTTGWQRQLGDGYTPKRLVETRGVSGYSTSDMLARVIADGPHYADQIVCFVDWTNVEEVGADAVANIKAAVAAAGAAKWFVMPPAQNVPNPSTANIAAVQAALLSDPFFAGHTLSSGDQAAYLAAVNDNATRTDGLHFNDAGQDIQTSYIRAFMDAAGW